MEIAHILFMDIVGYSKLRTVQQADVQRELQHQLQISGEVTLGRQQGKLIIRPTGDGAALLFLRDMLSPLRCAIQIQTLLRHNDAEIRARTGTSINLRMGVHSGPVIVTQDMNSQSDVAGEGINMAQRIMDCGDAGHILLSAEFAEKLRAVDPWPRYIQDIGECHVKHGVAVHLYNFYGKFDGIPCGMPGKPQRVLAEEKSGAGPVRPRGGRIPDNVRPWVIGSCLCLTALGLGYGLWINNPGFRQAVSKSVDQIAGTQRVAAKEPAKAKRTAVARTPRSHKREPVNEAPRPVEASVTPPIEAVAPPEKETVSVPSFLGMTLEEARRTANEHGIKVIRSVNSGYSLDYAEGLVYQQSIAEGTPLRAGKSLYVAISKGEPPDPAASPSPDSTVAKDSTGP